MKKLYYVIMCIILLHTNSIAQTLQPFVQTPYTDKVHDIVELSTSNQFLYLSDIREIEESTIFTDTSFSHIRVVDIQHNIIKQLDISSTKDTIAIARFILPIPDTPEFIVLGAKTATGQTTTFPFIQLFIIHIDEQLNIIHQANFSPVDSISTMFGIILNERGNLVCTGSYHEPLSSSAYISEYDLNGNQIHHANFRTTLPNNLMQRSDGTYQVLGYFGELIHFDEELVQTHLKRIFSNFSPNYVVKGIGRDEFIVSGLQRYSLFPINNSFDSNVLYLINASDSVQTLYEHYLPHQPELLRGLHALDFIDPQHIYFANTSEPCLLYGFYENCDAYISLYSVRSDGTLNWRKELGGEANYVVQQIVATQDKGCLLLADRHNVDDNNEEEDVFFIKLDKDGNVQDIFTDIPSSPLATTTILPYPNPATTHLYYDWDAPQSGSIDIYNANGQFILHAVVNSHEPTDLIGLTKGMYFYLLMDAEQQLVQKGQFVKQ